MKHWYDQAIIYQIYPKSFQDSNGDGIGDLNGIRKRIPYLKSLGINAVWLNPIFVSPQVDNGYDVSNYFEIDPDMGTMQDMDNLIKELHDAGIHIIMDFVLNHTSDQHPWFQDAINNPNSIYRDYYIFAGKNNKKPNNWGSFFGGSVWEKDPAGTGEFYFHLFDKKMPDLNWANPKVCSEMVKIAKYWLKKGIDGLRLDAFIHIAKADLRQSYPSNSGSDKPVIAEPFFANLPDVQTWMRPFCEEIKSEFPETLLLGEAASANVNLAADYTSKYNKLMDTVVTFRYFTEDETKIDKKLPASFQSKPLDKTEFKKNQAIWQQTLNNVSLPTLYWSNHDMPRLRTRYAKSDQEAASLAILMYLQRGIPIIYYGEELGMQNLEFKDVDEFNDLVVDDFVEKSKKLGLNQAEIIKMISQNHKMPARGPMPWNQDKEQGFSSAKPWIKGRAVDNVWVEDEKSDSTSMLAFYKELIQIKKTSLFTKGNYYLLNTDKDSYVYQRDFEEQSAIVAVSLSQAEVKIELPLGYDVPLIQSGKWNLEKNILTLQANSAVVLKKENK